MRHPQVYNRTGPVSQAGRIRARRSGGLAKVNVSQSDTRSASAPLAVNAGPWDHVSSREFRLVPPYSAAHT